MYKWLCACKCTHFWVSESKNKSLSSFQKGLYSKLLLFFNILHISLFQYLTYYLSLCSLNRNSSVSIFLGGDSRYHKKIGTRKRKKLVNRGCVIKSAPSVGYWGITAGTLGVSSAQNYRPQRVCNLKNFRANQSLRVVSEAGPWLYIWLLQSAKHKSRAVLESVESLQAVWKFQKHCP